MKRSKLPKPYQFSLFLVLAACVLFVQSAQAAVRSKCVQPFPQRVTPPIDEDSWEDFGACFSGHDCVVGVRGDWLDWTDEVSRVSGASADFSILAKGTERNPSVTGCLPEGNSEREGFVVINIANINLDGGFETIKIKMSRPGTLGWGRDSNNITVNVRRGRKYLENNVVFNAVANERRTYTFRGQNLDLLRLTNVAANRAPDDEIVSRTETTAVVRLTFTRAGTFTADQKLRFLGRASDLNTVSGFPKIEVREPRPPCTERTVTIATRGSAGTVASIGSNVISCPTDCSAEVDRFTNLSFRATPGRNSIFTGWTGSCSGTGDCAINNTECLDFSATAHFAPSFLLTVIKEGSGTVTAVRTECQTGGFQGNQVFCFDVNVPMNCSGNNCAVRFSNSNVTVRLSGLANPPGTFDGWSGDCSSQDPKTRVCTVNMNGDSRTVTARFSQ